MRSALITALFGAVIAAGPAMAADTVEATPKRGGTLTYMIPADAPPSLDGHREGTFAMLHALAPFYSVLMRVNPENPSDTTQFVCDLCTAIPKPTDDGKTYTFKIRTGVKFHDGSPLTAGRCGGKLAQDHLPPARGAERAAGLVVGGGLGRSARSDHRGVPPEIRHQHLPAVARGSLCVHLFEGDPREGCALVRAARDGLRSVQIRQP